VPGRNVIGIELPNARRETVFLRELYRPGTTRTTGSACRWRWARISAAIR
jgi:hypothetical protein